MTKRKTIICLLLILVIAGFFRLRQLGEIPPGLYPDEAINGNDALNSLETGQFKLFYPENNGREGLFIWLIAFSFSIFGPSIWAIKIVPAAIGVLTVLGLYLLTKELFKENSKFKAPNSKQILWMRSGLPEGLHSNIQNSKRFGIWDFGFGISRGELIALLSSFFLATSFWHVNFSRIGFRAIMVPFIMVFGFYFLFLGFNISAKKIKTKNYTLCRNRAIARFLHRVIKKEIFCFIISGFFFGLGFYTYISYRFVVFLLPITFWLFYRKTKDKKKFLLLTTYYLLLITFVVLPIGIYFLLNPGDFFGRAGNVSILSAEKPFYELGKSLIMHLGMFNIYGDANWRHNFAGSPVLLWPIGIFFLIGLIYSIKSFKFQVSPKQSRWKRDATGQASFMISWFFIFLLPGILSYEGIPHSLRVIGAIPPVFIFAGLGAYMVFEKLKKYFKTYKKQVISLYLCTFIFLASFTYAEFDKYFFQWARKTEVEDAFSKNYVALGNYLNSLPDDVQKYVIVNQGGVPVPYPDGIPMPAQTPMFIERTKFGKIRSTYILPEDLEKIKINEKTLIIPLHNSGS